MSHSRCRTESESVAEFPGEMSFAEIAASISRGSYWIVLDGWDWDDNRVTIGLGSELVSARDAIDEFDAAYAAALHTTANVATTLQGPMGTFEAPRDGEKPPRIRCGSLVGTIDYSEPDHSVAGRTTAPPSGTFLRLDTVLVAESDASPGPEDRVRFRRYDCRNPPFEDRTADRDGRSPALGERTTAVCRDPAPQHSESMFASPPPPPPSPLAAVADAAYRKQILRAKSAIRDGDAYVICVTTTQTLPRVEPTALHAAAQRAGRERFQAALSFGERSFVSTSPELYLDLTPERRVATEPIKGTRPRGGTPEEDHALEHDLRTSEKERAENTMIVDLVRNDLSRIAEPGTVSVDRLCDVEAHRRVFQLVSAVSAPLAPHRTLADVIEATFPAGSMTGAPKSSAMDLIAAIEQHPRGAYAGAFGVITPGHSVRLAMTIRTAVITQDATSVGTGAGITWLSDPDEEVAEMRLKVRWFEEAVADITGTAARSDRDQRDAAGQLGTGGARSAIE